MWKKPMVKRIATKSDLTLVRIKKKSMTKSYLNSTEKREIFTTVSEIGLYLYLHYSMEYFQCADDVTDIEVGKNMGWPTTKVAKYRRILEKEYLIKFVKEGPNTKLIVGVDQVILYNAGLPDRIHDFSAFQKIKRKLAITTNQELVDNMPLIQEYYQNNLEEFH